MISIEDERELIELLKKIEPGILPFEVFHQFARLYVSAIIIVVPLRKQIDGTIQVLLTRREKNDPVWANKLALPGTVLRSTDHEGDYSDAFNRIAGELQIVSLHTPVVVGQLFHNTARGAENTMIHYITIDESPVGIWCDVNNLPEACVGTDIPTINIAVDSFKNRL